MERHILTRGFEERDRERIVALLKAYEAAIGVSLSFQNFAAELAGLPGEYVPPRGALILAREQSGEELVGCVALRPMPGVPDACEMKRMYVRESARGSGLGRALALAVMADARQIGYSRMCLDTLPTLTAAQTLYRSLGFRQTGTQTGTAESAPTVLLFECQLSAQP
jgi:ribosomal protein S18 acetylase RimI-like enzyme